jgi:toxin FitB
MSFLIDTNVISELVRPAPNPQVLAWFEAVPDGALHLSALTLGEIRKGVDRLENSGRKEKLRLWLERDLPAWFGGRVLPVSADVADRWGRLLAKCAKTPPAVDSLIAATALHHGLRIVTRNEADFAFPELEVVNPWIAPA